LLIDGKFVDAFGGKTFPTEDPRTGEILLEVAEAQEDDVDKAVQAARKVSFFLLLLCHADAFSRARVHMSKYTSLHISYSDTAV
jgi:hypothetical protein